MALSTPGYDEEADEEHAPISDSGGSRNQTSPGRVSYNRGAAAPGRQDLRDAEENPKSEEDQGGFYNPGGDSTGSSGGGGTSSTGGSKAASPGSLKNSEQSGGGNSSGDGLYNKEGDNQGRFGALRRFRGKAQGLRSRAMGSKWVVGTAVGGGGAVIAMILLLTLFIGGYKVVDFAEHVGAYQFARVTRQMAESTNVVMAEKVGVDSAEGGVASGTYGQLKARYASAADKTSEVWSKLDKYRPNKAIQNLQGVKTLTYNYRSSKIFGRDILESVTIGSKTVPISNLKTLIPGYKFSKNIAIAREYAPSVNEALKTNNIGVFTRAKSARLIRQELGISLTAWVAGKYAGKPDEKIKSQAEVDAYEKAKGNSPADTSNLRGNLKDTATKAEEAQNNAVHDKEKIKEIVANPDQVPADVQQVIDSGLQADAMSSMKKAVVDFIGFINPVYKIATPLCLIYDGSLVRSGPTVKNQTQQLERTGVYVQTAKSEIQDGFAVNAEAVQGADWKLGDITKTNAEIRSAGGRVDTSNYSSPEASPTGLYSIADVGLGSSLGGVVDGLLQSGACDAFTNIWVAGGLGIGNLLLALATGGLSAAPEAGAEAAADVAAQSLASKILQKFVGAKDFTKTFAKDTVKAGALIGGATLVSKAIVSDNIGTTHNSLATGMPYGNDAEAGTGLYANQISQRQNYGAPLSDSELSRDDSDSKHQLAYQESQKGAFDRYLAIDDANSLLSRAGIMLSGHLGSSFVSSLFGFIGSIFSPLKSFGSMLSPLVKGSVSAATPVTSVNTYYGNVQFGYTREERALMKQSTYSLLENQRILTASQKEDEISGIYGACFAKDISDLLTAKGANQDGNDDYYVVRNAGGDVTGGICYQKNLGPHNSKYGDLVFRWRLANDHNNTLDVLIDEQDITADSPVATAATAGASSGTVASGTDAQLAQKLLDYKKTGKYNCDNAGDCTDLQKMVDGQTLAGPGGCQAKELDSRVLKLMLYMIETGGFKIGTYALCGDHGFDSPRGHSGGFAVDISSVNGVAVNQDTPEAKKQTLAADKFLNSLPSALQLSQQISYGYGNHYDKDLADTQQYGGKLCQASCLSIYTLSTELGHENHIHAGF